MVGKLIVIPSNDVCTGPLIFLAGPIQGAPDWQTEAIEIIRKANPAVSIASPRSPKQWHEDNDTQARWIHEYKGRAGREGVILFWFPCEATRERDRPYALTSSVEFGLMIGSYTQKRTKLVVGVQPGFPNETNMRETCRFHAPDVPFCRRLPDVCHMAVRLIQS